jgi:hypothetical protein
MSLELSIDLSFEIGELVMTTTRNVICASPVIWGGGDKKPLSSFAETSVLVGFLASIWIIKGKEILTTAIPCGTLLEDSYCHAEYHQHHCQRHGERWQDKPQRL